MNLSQKELFKFAPSIIPQTAAGDVTGVVVDTQGFGSAMAICFADDAVAGDFILQDSDASGSGFAAVADSLVDTSDGTNATAVESSGIVSIGYLGSKRYLRIFWDQTTGGEIAAGIALGCAEVAPTGTNS